jgi:hypothetical protein
LLSSFGSDWITSKKPLWHLAEALDDSPHTPLAAANNLKKRRRAYPIERAAGKLTVYKR